MKIWERYLLRQLVQTFLFFLLCIFTVFVVVDMSVNGVRFFSHAGTGWLDISLYYARNFAMHLDLFLPLSMLLSTFKVLFSSNLHCELVAFQVGGLSKKKLLRPFFLFASFLALISYSNSQWLAPDAQDAADAFRNAHHKNKKKLKRDHVYNVALSDDSELIYQSFNDEKKELFDVFWVKSGKDLWHMKYLNVDPGDPHYLEGRYVDHFERSLKGQLEKMESFITLDFPSIPWDGKTPLERFVPFENRSLSTLVIQAMAATADRQTVLAHLHYKIALPLISLFVILCISPIAMYFSRTRPAFLLVALALFSFIGMMTILDGMLILAENQVIPGYLAIWTPLVVFGSFFIRPFAKL